MSVLVCDQQPGVAVYGAEKAAHGLFRQVGQVIDLAQMRQDKVFETGVDDLTDDAHGVQVGEVSVITEDALLEIPVIGTVLEHLQVVIAFQDQSGAIGKMSGQQSALIAHIRGDGKFAFGKSRA